MLFWPPVFPSFPPFLAILKVLWPFFPWKQNHPPKLRFFERPKVSYLEPVFSLSCCFETRHWFLGDKPEEEEGSCNISTPNRQQKREKLTRKGEKEASFCQGVKAVTNRSRLFPCSQPLPYAQKLFSPAQFNFSKKKKKLSKPGHIVPNFIRHSPFILGNEKKICSIVLRPCMRPAIPI